MSMQHHRMATGLVLITSTTATIAATTTTTTSESYITHVNHSFAVNFS
jgi:hypothetical protein